MKTRGGQSIVRARGHAMTQLGARGDAGRRCGAVAARRRRQLKKETFCSILGMPLPGLPGQSILNHPGNPGNDVSWCYFWNYRSHDNKEAELNAARAAARSPQ